MCMLAKWDVWRSGGLLTQLIDQLSKQRRSRRAVVVWLENRWEMRQGANDSCVAKTRRNLDGTLAEMAMMMNKLSRVSV